MNTIFTDNDRENAIQILAHSQTLTLATVDENGHPWSTPLTYFFDGDKNIFVFCIQDSSHAKNMKKNPKVALSIFWQTKNFPEDFWLQIIAISEKITENTIAPHIRSGILSRISPIILAHNYECFCLKIEHIFIPNPKRWQSDCNMRHEISL